ncbi:uncharacterized protein KY384_005025 [Bacidia gigantensis]|uniref:uncharacterized protein n=1 Tax=Bacidia gigantensis TaxID=2732470 RepID=UPI001D04B789|nr:uncharacterized protein KY384_005025 [Bacidia gigantensis]KAG8530522.1 hypothetical protein KY384_005025 [Bacidia gigantensis]
MTGGQTPLHVLQPPKGVANKNFAEDLTTLNLSKLVSWIAQRRINPAYPITIKELRQSRCVSNVKDGVKLLARGLDQLSTPINIVVSKASASAIKAIESAGGSVFTRYYTPFAIRKILEGKMDPVNSLMSAFPRNVAVAAGRVGGDELVDEGQEGDKVGEEGVGSGLRQYLYRLPDPAKRRDLEYYRDPAHRGYLAHMVPEGHGPSLYFRTPGVGANVRKRVVQNKQKKVVGNTMW